MKGDVVITVKNPNGLSDWLTQPTKLPKVWSKSVTGIDMKQQGGFRLVGSFYQGKFEFTSDEYIYRVDQQKLDGQISVACVDVNIGASYRAVFVIVPAGRLNQVPPGYVTRPPGSTALANIIVGKEVLAEIQVELFDKSLFITSFINHETTKNKNSLVSAADFIEAHLKKAPSLSTSPVAATPEKLVPYVEDKPKKKKKKAKTRTDNFIKFQKRPKLAVPGKGINLPDRVEYMGDIDGIKILLVDGVPHFMHILADFENVTEELRKVMLDQSLNMAGMAETYKIVANMGKDKGD